MIPRLQDLIELVAEICDERQLKVAVTESLKGGLITGLSAAIGGILLGPVGLAVGGAIGGGASALSSKGKYKSVAIIILRLTPEQKKKLYVKFLHAFRGYSAEDAVSLILLLSSGRAVKDIAVDVVKEFLRSDMSLQVLPS